MKRSFVSDLGRSLRYLRPHYRRIGLVVALTLLTSTLPALEPLAQKSIFDRLTSPGHGRAALLSIWPLAVPALILAALVVSRLVLEAVASLAAYRVRLRVHSDLLAETTSRLHALPLSYHQSRGVGDTMTRLDRGIGSFMDGLSSVAFQMAPALFYLLVSVVIMAKLSPPLALLAVGFIVPPLLFGRRTTTHLVARERLVLDRWCDVYNRFQQVLSGIKTVKAFVQEAAEHARFLRQVEGAQAEVMTSVGLQTRLALGRNVCINVGRVAVLGVGGLLVAKGSIGVGTLVAFLTFVGGLYGPAQTLLGLYETARRAELGLEAIFGVLDAEDAVPDAKEAVVPARIEGCIELERVSFKHDLSAGGPPALDRVSVRIEPGELVCVVGPSGAGKTTLADLILRMHDPTEGVVRIDGRDLKTFSQTGLRRHIGVVTQDAFLFEDTIEANIRYGSEDRSAAEVEQAVRAAQVEGFLRRLPDGLATLVGRGGVHLSGGERQCIAIARTLLRDPSIVLLDEATSSLDVEGEAAIQRALDQLAEGRTTLMITHRLGATVNADRILVIERGRVVEEGPPRELLRCNGPYRRLMRLSQARPPFTSVPPPELELMPASA